MKSTATVQVGGAPAKFLQVFPFMNGLSGFVNRHKKKGRGGGRAAAPERTPTKPPPPTQAPPPASPAAGVGGGGRMRPLQSQPLQGEFDEGMAWQPSTKDRFGFDEMVQQNARLRRGDAMRPYDGIIPQQQQVMQQKQLAQQVRRTPARCQVALPCVCATYLCCRRSVKLAAGRGTACAKLPAILAACCCR